MSALQKNAPVKYIIEIVEGPDKGEQFQLIPGEIRIGRGESNDIILNDVRCSREHALLKISENEIYIENVSQNNTISVDGQMTQKAQLFQLNKISLGNTTLLFKKLDAVGSAKPKLSVLSSFDSIHFPKSNSGNNKMKFYIIVTAVVGFILWLLDTTTKSLDNNIAPLSIEEEIEMSKKRQEDLLREQQSSGKNTRQYLDSQAAYMKGLRDYREGLYRSAMVSFSAALAIHPEHPTARRYYDLSKLKLEEQIQFLLREGNRHMEQKKYRLAMASYRNAMLLIGDSQNKFFEEAKTKYNEAYLLMRGAF